MGNCYQCRSLFEDRLLTEWLIWVERSYDRRKASSWTPEEFEARTGIDEKLVGLNADYFVEWLFPNIELTVTLCPECYERETGHWPTLEPTGRDAFLQRLLASTIAVSLARSLFERCGYEVRHAGYEHTMPEWANRMKRGDPNPAVARARNIPDLYVYDPKINSLHSIEIKTTRSGSAEWIYPKNQLDTLRTHHPDAILMVYSQPLYRFAVQTIKLIAWQRLQVEATYGRRQYVIDLNGCVEPHQFFEYVTQDDYTWFRDNTKQVLGTFV
jgi:hypothetical protein